ncbi:hypothetical protein R1sor_016874 [Riccia sorocarpa]|uniref:non-specific serine/threonine protein kinase n=1 Tax=Riccia sorocarpa TaxID=122646 RepID=A0ABD3HJU1_9MARC
MGWKRLLVLLTFGLSIRFGSTSTDVGETAALLALKKSLGDRDNQLASWQGDDPCGDQWTGVYCVETDYPSYLTGSNNSHITELRLLQMNFNGYLAQELGDLPALKVFNVMWNQLTGSIPPSIEKLQNLRLLLLSGNQFNGDLPLELGMLAGLQRLQIDQNRFTGPIPSTFLDRNLPLMHHLHMNNNSLNGSIPPELGTLSNLAHLLLDNNQLTGTLPPELANAPNLMILQFDNNMFDSGATIPEEYGKIPKLLKLSLRNCNLLGSIPDLSGSPQLEFLDVSHNFLSGSIPNNTIWSNMSSVDLSFNNFSGSIPASIGSFPNLQYLVLRNNNLSGDVPGSLGSGEFFIKTNSVSLVDLQNNQLVDFANGSNLVFLSGQGKTKVWMAGNPFCGRSSTANNPLCVPNDESALFDVDNLNQVFGFDQSSCTPCPAPYALAPSYSAPIRCRCAAPIIVKTRLKSYSFGLFEPYKQQFITYVADGLHLAEEQVQIKEIEYEPGPRLGMTLLLFPTGFSFNSSETARLYQAWSHWELPLEGLFGPYEFISFQVTEGAPTKDHSGGLSKGAIAGIVVGVIMFVILKTVCMIYVTRLWMQRKHKRDLAGGCEGKKMRRLRSHCNIQVASVRSFTFEEMEKATDYFNEEKVVGKGGYGKVYEGVLDDGQRVAIKRAEVSSFQGAHEFENEILLLSRVHHKNLVSLVGYCNDGSEQMLVYEFIAYGSLQHHLFSQSTVPFKFVTRLQIALGSARGIHYLHTEANPPIYHRDVKASNILLDEKFHAKVADFGLSKLAPESGKEGKDDYISTVVKGTPGYLDPEYFKTHRLTEKSDVYSFGVVLLVLLTGMQPISDGKNLVREVDAAYVAGKLGSIVDFRIKDSYSNAILECLARLALSCCRDSPAERPTIGEVLRELELLYQETRSSMSEDFVDLDLVDGTEESKKLRGVSESESFFEIDPSDSSIGLSSSDPDFSITRQIDTFISGVLAHLYLRHEFISGISALPLSEIGALR